MKFSEKRKETKLLKTREKILKGNLRFEEAVYYTKLELFQDCHIVPEETNDGIHTGRYYLVPDKIAREQLERKNEFSKIESLQERIHCETPIIKYNNYQAAAGYQARSGWGR